MLSLRLQAWSSLCQVGSRFSLLFYTCSAQLLLGQCMESQLFVSCSTGIVVTIRCVVSYNRSCHHVFPNKKKSFSSSMVVVTMGSLQIGHHQLQKVGSFYNRYIEQFFSCDYLVFLNCLIVMFILSSVFSVGSRSNRQIFVGYNDNVKGYRSSLT